MNEKKLGLERYWYENGEKQQEICFVRDKEYAKMEWDKKGNVIEANFPTLKRNNNKQKTKQNDPRFN